MTIDEALMAYLKAFAGLTALVGSKIYFDDAPQGTAPPYVIITDVSNVILSDLKGEIDLEQPNKQFTAYATSRAGARAVADQLRAALSDYHGTLSGLVVQRIKLLTDLTSKDTGSDGRAAVYMTDLEYEITYEKE